MSTHPNVILLLVLKPDDLARKTYRGILEDAGIDDDNQLKIGADEYFIRVMEGGYDEDFQISADEGDIIVFDMITYGYGERKAWSDLIAQKAALDEWAAAVCQKHNCTASVFITANYW